MRPRARFSLPGQAACSSVESERIVLYGRSAEHLQCGLRSDRRGSGTRGFEYRPSKHSLVRRDDDLTREITFQSSFSEISPFQASRLLLILRFRLARRPVLWSLMPQEGKPVAVCGEIEMRSHR